MLKPAETTPVTTVRLAELAADILPAGVLNVVMGEGDPTGARLVTHPDVTMVSLTGSPGTGKWIAKAASARVYDDVVAGLAEQAKGLVLGDTASADTTLGPVTRPSSASASPAFSSEPPATPRW